jgi:hypothetical protein
MQNLKIAFKQNEKLANKGSSIKESRFKKIHNQSLLNRLE